MTPTTSTTITTTIAMVLVKIGTGGDGGTPSASTGNWRAIHAFDGVTDVAGNCWHSNKGMPQWMQYQFHAAQKVLNYSITARVTPPYTDYDAPRDFMFLGSVNGETFTELD